MVDQKKRQENGILGTHGVVCVYLQTRNSEPRFRLFTVCSQPGMRQQTVHDCRTSTRFGSASALRLFDELRHYCAESRRNDIGSPLPTARRRPQVGDRRVDRVVSCRTAISLQPVFMRALLHDDAVVRGQYHVAQL